MTGLDFDDATIRERTGDGDVRLMILNQIVIEPASFEA